MKVFTNKRTIIGLVAVVAAVAVSFGAYAYFTDAGHGTGTATVGTSTQFTVAQDAFGGAGPAAVTLYPGVGTQALTGTVANAGAGHQSFNTIVANVVAPTGPNVGGSPACTAADFALTSPGSSWVLSNAGDTATLTLATQDLAPSGVYHFSDLSVSMNNLPSNQDSCKNATVNLTYDVSTQ
jgi:hypothetical protein